MKNLFANLIVKLLPETASNEDAVRERSMWMVIYFAIIVFFAAVSYTIVYLWVGMPISALGAGQAIVVSLIALWAFRRTGSVKLAGNLLALAGFMALSIIVFGTGMLEAPGICWFFLGPLTAVLIAGRASGLFWYVASISVLTTCYLTHGQSWILASEIPDFFRTTFLYFVPLGLVTAVFAVAWSFGVAQEKALTMLATATQVAESARHQAERSHADALLVLNNVAEGLVIVSAAGTMEGEPSARFREWFPNAEKGKPIWEALCRETPQIAEWLEVSWGQLENDLLPVEVALDQLPTRFELGSRHFSLAYRPLLVGENLEHVLLICTDITAELAAEQADRFQQEQMAIFTRFVRDPQSVADFLEEADRLVALLVRSDQWQGPEKRWLHTLKGNCATFGLRTFASWLHKLEDQLIENPSCPEEIHRDAVELQWSVIRERLSTLVDEDRDHEMTVDRKVFEQTLRAAENGVTGKELAMMMRRWTWDNVGKRLDLLADRAIGLAERLEKPGLQVDIQADDVWLPPSESWPAFWGAMIHVVRNGIDHGIESPETRLKTGKNPAGNLTLRATDKENVFMLEVQDDGAGIDWGQIAERANRLGIPCETQEQFREALFADGLSTRAQVSDISGRGVGMGAVRESCQALGGTIEIQSVAEQGTTFRFLFPIQSDSSLDAVEPCTLPNTSAML